jgi:serine/threonine protein kinase
MRELAVEKTRLDSRYDIQRLLGRGSYAEIYLALDHRAPQSSPHERVVIKALNVFLQEDPDAELERTLIENFQNEAVALDRVRHPNVISRLGHGTARDLHRTIFHYLVLEYLSGGDLALLCKQAPLTLDKTLFYLEQVCAGLSFAHSKNVIHRDIKPHNLLLTADQKTVKIADFGVAKLEQNDAPITRVGTNIYAAPEHSPFNYTAEISEVHSIRLTPAADVYSLAKTVYVLLTGESPRKFVNAPITSLPASIANKSWANEVLKVLERATQTDLNQRCQTVLEFWQDFAKAATSLITVEEATRVAVRESVAAAHSAIVPRATGSLAGFSAQAPEIPSFNSLPNVQTVPQNAEILPERPRLVVELAEKPKQEKTVLNQYSSSVINQENNFNQTNQQFDLHRSKQHSGNDQMLEHVPDNFISKLTNRFTAALKRAALRLAVVLLMLSVFVGVLGGTYNYLQTSGYLPSIFPAMFARKAIVTEDANLRSSPGLKDGNVVNLVTKGSKIKIWGEEENWYKVEIIQQAQPDRTKSDETRGWISKNVEIALQ